VATAQPKVKNKMTYECIVYKNGIAIDWLSPVINEDDVTETEEGLHIVLGNNDTYDFSKEDYDFYELDELDTPLF
jgi:hypothetical protein